VLAIGGVTAARVAELRAGGAHGVAVIRAVWSAPEPVQAAEELAKLLET
jgi:thiamine-phosphate pyrophosphorylase